MIILTQRNGKRQQLYSVSCDRCGKLNPSHCRRSSIAPADFYLCPICARLSVFQLEVPVEYVYSVDFNAAPGSWIGYTIRYATQQDIALHQRVQKTLALGLAQLCRKEQLQNKDYIRRSNMEGSHTKQEWEELKNRFAYTCLRCGKQEPDIQLSKDHIVPVVHGGTDYIDNIQPLCITCNRIKKDKTIDYRLPVARGLSCIRADPSVTGRSRATLVAAE